MWLVVSEVGKWCVFPVGMLCFLRFCVQGFGLVGL